MAKILNRCPLCGDKLEYNDLNQYSEVYAILNNGKKSKRRTRKEDIGSIYASFISCVNKDCDFVTNCDLSMEDSQYKCIEIYCKDGIYYYETEDDE